MKDGCLPILIFLFVALPLLKAEQYWPTAVVVAALALAMGIAENGSK